MGVPADARLQPLSESELERLRGAFRAPEPRDAPGLFTVRIGATVDRVRQLHARFGTHMYRVFLVHAIWTSNVRGIGKLAILHRREILPIPRVREMASIAKILRSTGLSEEGTIVVDRISTSYSEDDLTGMTPDLEDPGLPRTSKAAVEFSWEVEEVRSQRPGALIRRFRLAGVPSLEEDAFQWTCSLTKADGDRARDGSTDRSHLRPDT